MKSKIGFAQPSRDCEQRVSTGCSSTVELLMTFSTSEVAVCCSSDSAAVRACTSSNSRTFSIAITA